MKMQVVLAYEIIHFMRDDSDHLGARGPLHIFINEMIPEGILSDWESNDPRRNGLISGAQAALACLFVSVRGGGLLEDKDSIVQRFRRLREGQEPLPPELQETEIEFIDARPHWERAWKRERNILTIPQAAQEFGIPLSTLYSAASQLGRKVGTGWILDREKLKAWIERS